MAFYRRYSLVLGLCALVLVMLLLLSSPGLIFSSGVTFIDSELQRSSGEEVYVRTKMDFGDAEQVNNFPREFGEWTGYDYDTSSVRESLGADAVLLRGYECPGLYQPIFFLIVQGRTETSFHSPSVCYAALNFEIEERGKEEVRVTDANWLGGDSSTVSIPLEKIVVFKESGGKVTERLAVLYCYVRGNQLTSDTVTMFRVEALAPVEGSYDSILNLEKEFIAEAIPYLFEPGRGEEWNPLAARIAGFGAGGYFLIILLFLLPLAIIVYPRTRWGRGSGEEYGSNI